MFGGRYFGGRYFGGRYFGKSGLVVDGAYHGARYFGPRFFGPRYFGSNGRSEGFEVDETASFTLSGVVGVGGTLVYGSDLALTQSGNIGLTGSVSIGAALSFDSEDFVFSPPLEVSGLAGVLTVAGNITIGAPTPGYGGYWGRRYFGARHYGPRYFGAPDSWIFDQSANIGLAGVVNVAGGIETAFALSESTGIGLTGSLTVEGDLGEQAVVKTAAPKATRVKSKNYIIKGRKYFGLSDEELRLILATEFEEVKRSQVKVQEPGEAPKTIPMQTWEQVRPDDEEDILLLL